MFSIDVFVFRISDVNDSLACVAQTYLFSGRLTSLTPTEMFSTDVFVFRMSDVSDKVGNV